MQPPPPVTPARLPQPNFDTPGVASPAEYRNMEWTVGNSREVGITPVNSTPPAAGSRAYENLISTETKGSAPGSLRGDRGMRETQGRAGEAYRNVTPRPNHLEREARAADEALIGEAQEAKNIRDKLHRRLHDVATPQPGVPENNNYMHMTPDERRSVARGRLRGATPYQKAAALRAEAAAAEREFKNNIDFPIGSMEYIDRGREFAAEAGRLNQEANRAYAREMKANFDQAARIIQRGINGGRYVATSVRQTARFLQRAGGYYKLVSRGTAAGVGVFAACAAVDEWLLDHMEKGIDVPEGKGEPHGGDGGPPDDGDDEPPNNGHEIDHPPPDEPAASQPGMPANATSAEDLPTEEQKNEKAKTSRPTQPEPLPLPVKIIGKALDTIAINEIFEAPGGFNIYDPDSYDNNFWDNTGRKEKDHSNDNPEFGKKGSNPWVARDNHIIDMDKYNAWEHTPWDATGEKKDPALLAEWEAKSKGTWVEPAKPKEPEKPVTARSVADVLLDDDRENMPAKPAAASPPVAGWWYDYDYDDLDKRLQAARLAQTGGTESVAAPPKPRLNGSVLNTTLPFSPLGTGDPYNVKSSPIYNANRVNLVENDYRKGIVHSDPLTGDLLSEKMNDPRGRKLQTSIPTSRLVENADIFHPNVYYEPAVNPKEAYFKLARARLASADAANQKVAWAWQEPKLRVNNRDSEVFVGFSYDTSNNPTLPAQTDVYTVGDNVPRTYIPTKPRMGPQLYEASQVVGIGFDERNPPPDPYTLTHSTTSTVSTTGADIAINPKGKGVKRNLDDLSGDQAVAGAVDYAGDNKMANLKNPDVLGRVQRRRRDTYNSANQMNPWAGGVTANVPRSEPVPSNIGKYG